MNVTKPQKTYRFFQTFYFFAFFGFGALFPLLSVYLETEKGLSHTQIGLVVAAIPIVTIFIQPLWGMMSDYTRKPRRLLVIAAVMASVMSFAYTWLDGFILLLLGIVGIALFQSAVVPLSDSLSLNFVQVFNKEYGNIRLWGAVGFAVAVFVVGQITDRTGDLSWIFYAFSLGLLLSVLALSSFPKQGQQVQVDFRTGFKTLVKEKTFIVFLVSNFLIFGPVLANNYYFGTFILTTGGTLTGVGIAFLIAAGSEAPFMNIAQKVINRLDVTFVMLICAFISGSRWLFYFFEPSTALVYATTIVQGVSVGLYIPAALLFVRKTAPKAVQATAVGIYSAVGNGMGNAFFTFIGGVLLDYWSVYGMYGFFAGMTFIGMSLLIYIRGGVTIPSSQVSYSE
ncbi:MFS transporter [Pontibacillus yanchengensis]|uniref:MFS transporter n=1 Tax=Pontibacillus yanchengensis Y32 TaxID=1385514 RepID=A0A0A2T6U3_9BACI|nr:MFS transporter [Pontibacillus yanchengensis]KGP71219.1 MFS transporter [Pontibacillus yanchengensis Y32]